MISTLDDKEIKYVILHQLSHYKRKDILIVWLSKIVEITQFFNPLIRFGLKIMKEDCEEACDEYVLGKLEKNENKAYGNTIIKVNSKALNLIDKNKVNSIYIKVLPSPPKQKVIDKEEDINKIIKEINSIKVKDKKVGLYNGWEINILISREETYDISFVGEYINIDGIQYKIEKNEREELRKLYENLNYEETDVLISKDNEKEKTYNKANKDFIEKVQNDGYSINLNSQTGGPILLPRNFEAAGDGERIKS